MRPNLLTLHFGTHGLDIHAYGFLIAVGAIAGVLLALRQGRRMGFDTAAVLDLTFWALVAGIVGSRVLYVLVHVSDYGRLCAGVGLPRPALRVLGDCAAPLYIWQGGLVFYGGALAAAAVVLLFARRRSWSLGNVADLLAPSLALGHALGRVGCFLAGCCYGKVSPFGVHFPPASAQLACAPAKMAGETAFMATSPSVRIWPVDSRTTCTSAEPLVGALMGTRKLICPGETRSSGAGWPLNSTWVSARSVGNGIGLGCWLALAVSVPNVTPGSG